MLFIFVTLNVSHSDNEFGKFLNNIQPLNKSLKSVIFGGFIVNILFIDIKFSQSVKIPVISSIFSSIINVIFIVLFLLS